MSDYLARRRARHEAATPAAYWRDWTGRDGEFMSHARNDEAATIAVLEAAEKWRRAVLAVGIRQMKWQKTESALADVAAAELVLIAALDALEGEREREGGEG